MLLEVCTQLLIHISIFDNMLSATFDRLYAGHMY